MSEQMRRAWLDFLHAETAAHPVLLVLDDLHWGDFGTVRFIDAALRDLRQAAVDGARAGAPRGVRGVPQAVGGAPERPGAPPQGARPQGRRAAGPPGARRHRRQRHGGAPGQAGRRQRVLPRGADPRRRRGQGRGAAGDRARHGRDPARAAPARGAAGAARRQRVRRGVLGGGVVALLGEAMARGGGRASGWPGWSSRRCWSRGRTAGSPASASSRSATRCSARAPTPR